MMKQYILLLLLSICLLPLQAQIQKMRERNSLSVILLNNGKQTDQEFNKTCEKVKEIYFQPKHVKDYDINYIQANIEIPDSVMGDAASATAYLNQSDVGRKVMAYLWGRDKEGKFHIDTIVKRAFKNASKLLYQVAEDNIQQDALVKDAGLLLIDDAHVLILNVSDLKTKDQSYNQMDSIAAVLGLPKMSRGFIGYDVQVEGYLFRLAYDTTVRNTFYNTMWIKDKDSANVKEQKKKTFDSYCFPFDYVSTVRKQALDINKSALAAVLSNSKKVKKMQLALIRKLSLTLDPVRDNPLFTSTISFPIPKTALIRLLPLPFVPSMIRIKAVESSEIKKIKLSVDWKLIVRHKLLLVRFNAPESYTFKLKDALSRLKRQEFASYIEWHPRAFSHIGASMVGIPLFANILLSPPSEFKFPMSHLLLRSKRQEFMTNLGNFSDYKNLQLTASIPEDVGLPLTLQIPKTTLHDLSAYAVMNTLYHNLPIYGNRSIYDEKKLKIEIGTKEGIHSEQRFVVYEKRYRYNSRPLGVANPIMAKRVAVIRAGSNITYNEGMTKYDSIKLTSFHKVSGVRRIKDGMWVKPARKELGLGVHLLGNSAFYLNRNITIGGGVEANVSLIAGRYFHKGFITGLRLGTNVLYSTEYKLKAGMYLRKDWYPSRTSAMRIGTYIGFLGSKKAVYPVGLEWGTPLSPNANLFCNYEYLLGANKTDLKQKNYLKFGLRFSF